MNWRYFVGKSLAEAGNTILSSKLMPLTRVVPPGISYPYDIKRFIKSYKLNHIFDVGANIGQTSLFLNRHFPTAQIFAFEPIQETYKKLQENTHKINSINPFHCALGSCEKEASIQVRDNSELNSLINSNDLDPGCKQEQIFVTTLDCFCRKHQINQLDLLKMDVQGYEMEVLRGAETLLTTNSINFVYSEIGFDRFNQECQYFSEINDLLHHYNFQFSGFYETFRWGENKRYFGFCNALFVHANV